MTRQYDPEHRARMRREAGNWNALPLILGAVFLFALGFLLLSDTTNPPGRSSSVEATTPAQ